VKVCYIGHVIEIQTGNSKAWGRRPRIPKFTIEQVRELDHILRFLNSKDRDILYLIFVSRKKQNNVQYILNRSQPSLCYDVRRIKKRLEFIYYLHSVFDIFIDFVEERSSLYDPIFIEILVLMFYTSSFTLTAKILRMSQLHVRYRFDKAMNQMEELGHWDIFEIFYAIRSNLNIIRRVYGDRNSS